MNRRILIVLIMAISVCFFVTATFAKDSAKGRSGAELFSRFCAECHPDGGNLSNLGIRFTKLTGR